MNLSDHRAMFIELDLVGLLALDVEAQRLPPPKKREFKAKLNRNNTKEVTNFQDRVKRGMEMGDISVKVEQLEMAAKGYRTEDDQDQSDLQGHMDEVMRAALAVLKEAEDKVLTADSKPTTKKVQRSRKKHGSPELSKVRRQLRALGRIEGLCARQRWWDAIAAAQRYEEDFAVQLGSCEMFRTLKDGKWRREALDSWEGHWTRNRKKGRSTKSGWRKS